MADALHQIQIDASPARVFEAITTAAGLRAWWTDDSAAEPRVGSIAEFGFGNRASVFRMRIAELKPNARVVWECLGDVDEWKGTRLTWALTEQEGKTDVRFTHGNWRSTDGWFALCNTTWGELMYRLKNYIEGKAPGPRFTGQG